MAQKSVEDSDSAQFKSKAVLVGRTQQMAHMRVRSRTSVFHTTLRHKAGTPAITTTSLLIKLSLHPVLTTDHTADQESPSSPICGRPVLIIALS